ncbi:uncharacterized protein BDZ99DRAFT_281263 [Mytilinidion resinicola]|uniref:BTB domain-containing protein n=1 Tax=Mytilinidion resinicola TaxID=574789 RepID=A0A6A6YV40_9PEZI|nr:uncharacterized protein BDZ99DRAFT_281263 [Mytilinidion resinicola]KAF2811827.1 hypothetical protein BDZ99DRAFT_281263 [Mytilinidion resinicola]
MDTTPENNEKSPEMTDIILDKDGDVIFLVGDGDVSVSRIRVSSKVLILSSPVFEAMFTHGFAEGHNLSATSPRVIPLPDDGVLAMTLLCQIIHHKHQDVPKALGMNHLVELTILCGKYDCVLAVQPWGMIWTTELLPRAVEEGFEKLLFITYGLDLAENFFKLTEHLVKNRLVKIEVANAIPGYEGDPELFQASLPETLEEARAERIQKVLEAFESVMIPFLDGPYTTRECQRSTVTDYFHSLSAAGLWPLSRRLQAFTIPQILKILDKVSLPRSDTCECEIWEGGCHLQKTSPDGIIPTLCAGLQAIDKATTGICLDCWRVGREAYDMQECRVKH